MKTPTPAQLAAAAVAAILTLIAAGCGTDPAATDATSETRSSSSSSAGVEPEDISPRSPWPAPGDVPARVAAAGLDLGPMGTAEHYHPTLAITINDQPVPVPP